MREFGKPEVFRAEVATVVSDKRDVALCVAIAKAKAAVAPAAAVPNRGGLFGYFAQ